MDSIIVSIDDYTPINLKTAEMLETRGLRGLFFVECARQEAIDQIRELHKRGHKIGSHTITHPSDMKNLRDDQIEWEVKGSKDIIENAIGDQVEWFCYPKGKYDERVKHALKEAGYKYARTTNKEDRGDLELGGLHMYPREYYGGRFWHEYIAEKAKRGKLKHAWMHSWEIEKFGKWKELGMVLDSIRRV